MTNFHCILPTWKTRNSEKYFKVYLPDALIKTRRDNELLERNLFNLQASSSSRDAKARRRSRKEKLGRENICGCGKTYFSYPALYTHIKNKHCGIAPAGTELDSHRRSIKPNRGEVYDPEDETPFQADNPPPSDDKNAVFSESQVSFSSKEVFRTEPFGVIEELGATGSCDFTYSFNTDEVHPLIKAANRFISSKNFNSLKTHMIKSLNCYTILGCFLLEISKQSCPEIYSVIATFIRGFCECLNFYGYSLLQIFERDNPKATIGSRLRISDPKLQNDDYSSQEFCEIEGVGLISLLFDFFIKIFLPNFLKTKKFPLKLALATLAFLNSWLVRNGLTDISASI